MAVLVWLQIDFKGTEQFIRRHAAAESASGGRSKNPDSVKILPACFVFHEAPQITE